jgi:hypothetical protein
LQAITDNMEKELIFPEWQYDEMQQVGTDYTDEAQVEAYDQRLQRLRDVKEYSSFDWIMETLPKKAGFHIDKADYFEGFMAVYVCTKL